MKKISTNGITYLEPLEEAGNIDFGTDAIRGDFYEAEELFRRGETVSPNRSIFATYPEGVAKEAVTASAGQYFGDPEYFAGDVYMEGREIRRLNGAVQAVPRGEKRLIG